MNEIQNTEKTIFYFLLLVLSYYESKSKAKIERKKV